MEPAHGRPARPPSPTNAMGIAGFVLSLVGFVTCGILSPLGLVFSLIGLGREPSGLAIAGTVVSAPGLIPLGMVVFGWDFVQTGVAFAQASMKIDKSLHGAYPDEEAAERLLADIKDGWDRPLRYERSGYRLATAGMDGEFGTEDDFEYP